MALFKSDEQKLAIKELEKYIVHYSALSDYYVVTPEFMVILIDYGITSSHKIKNKELYLCSGIENEKNTMKFFEIIYKKVNNEIKNNILSAKKVQPRLIELLDERYGVDGELIKKQIEKKEELIKNFKIKFGIDLSDKVWFHCSIGEMRQSTFGNDQRMKIVWGYVIIYDQYIEIYKESVINKSDMGHRKIFFENVTSIDHDKKGTFNLSSSVMINTKSDERAVHLRNVSDENYNLLVEAFDSYMHQKINRDSTSTQTASAADELLKFAELYEKGLLTKEEFDAAKKKLLGL